MGPPTDSFAVNSLLATEMIECVSENFFKFFEDFSSIEGQSSIAFPFSDESALFFVSTIKSLRNFIYLLVLLFYWNNLY